MTARPVVGVFALQGDVREHVRALTACGATAVPVRRPAELDDVDGLVIPGGESTTMSKLSVDFGLFDPIAKRIADGMPVYGSCAGMIMLASTVLDGRPDQRSFGAISMTVRRNAFGRQVDSFEATGRGFGSGHPVPRRLHPGTVGGVGRRRRRGPGLDRAAGRRRHRRAARSCGPPSRGPGHVLPPGTDRRPPPTRPVRRNGPLDFLAGWVRAVSGAIQVFSCGYGSYGSGDLPRSASKDARAAAKGLGGSRRGPGRGGPPRARPGPPAGATVVPTADPGHELDPTRDMSLDLRVGWLI